MMGMAPPDAARRAKGSDMDSEIDEEIDISTSGTEPAAKPDRPHSVAVHLLIALAAVVLLVTAVNVWVDRAALNTDNWVDASDQLLAEPAVREAVAVYVVDQLYTNIDVGAQLGELLPGDLSGIAGALASALRNPATDAVDRLLATDQVAAIWSSANRVAHETIVNILEDDTRVQALSTSGGSVTLDLREVVVQLADDLGLPGTVVDRIPADAGQITIIESSKLEDLQTAVTFVQWASWLLFFVVIGIYAGAIFLADGWRRIAARSAGVSILIVGLLVLAGLRFGGDRLLDSVVENASNRGAAEAVWRIGSALLRDIGWNITAVGALIVVGAFLAGPARVATAVRRFISPAFVGGPGVRWGIGGAIFLVMVMWAPLPALTNWFGILVFAGILAACIEGLRGLCLADQSRVIEERIVVDVVEVDAAS
jgi:Ca2+/Na+ antiporter